MSISQQVEDGVVAGVMAVLRITGDRGSVMLSQKDVRIFLNRSSEWLARYRRQGLFLRGERYLKRDVIAWMRKVDELGVRWQRSQEFSGDVDALKSWIESRDA